MTINEIGKSCAWMMMYMACTLIAGPSLAGEEVNVLVQEQVLVRELMHLDSDEALVQARQRRALMSDQTMAPPRTSAVMRGTPSLRAIYGVGRNLMAEVVLDNRRYLYRRGQVLPVGVAPGPEVYMLQDISSSCIKLRLEETASQFCLDTSKWGVE